MTDKAQNDPYADLVRRVLADEITPEAAAREAADLLQRAEVEGPHGFSLSFLGSSPQQSERLKQFSDLAKEELLRRLTK